MSRRAWKRCGAALHGGVRFNLGELELDPGRLWGVKLGAPRMAIDFPRVHKTAVISHRHADAVDEIRRMPIRFVVSEHPGGSSALHIRNKCGP